MEVEVKARAPLGRVRSRLRELGARLLRVEEQEDVYFSHPCRDFSRTDEALRLRLAGGGAELTYKGPRGAGPVKSRLEVTARVVDAERLVEILELLGFREVARIRKRREIYELRGVEVALDQVEGLGEFIELESRGASPSELLELARKLGATELVSETYLEMILRKRGSPLRS
ncbi:MAG: class IV adenylate cyclase [Thermoprotei archaeon]|nr:MAG: class IV adenylate cyclase [Thermoprotei archaeon]